jgi:AraC-like DNA-binding protein
LTHLRLAEAARLLRIGDHTIAEVADLLGFSDQSHFDRRFKRAFGVTPSQFQKQDRVGH